MTQNWALGVDIGSVTIKFLLLDEKNDVHLNSYHRTMGSPLRSLISGMVLVGAHLPDDCRIGAVGTTGSGRYLAAAFLGADLVKNEITTHAVGTLSWRSDIRTIIEIGGQDSKIIHLRDGMVNDFAMNTVCAAGTGAFLDQQALRLEIPISEFGEYALQADMAVRIAGRCSVFAESDMIHKQQAGYDNTTICLGLCQALVRNYLNNVARGKRLEGPISIQGGVAYNQAIVKCFRDALPGCEILIPPHVTGCGALGAACLAREAVGNGSTCFRGKGQGNYSITPHHCENCVNQCEIFTILRNGKDLARWGGRCERGNAMKKRSPELEKQESGEATADP